MSSKNKILLSVSTHEPVSDFVYSSFGGFAHRKDDSLSGSWFIDHLTPLGVAEGAIRMTLFRMERSGALEAHKEGRQKFYRASAATRAVLATAKRRLSGRSHKWNGQWTIVVFRFGAGKREPRERMREVLMVDAFAPIAKGTYVHPRDRVDALRRTVNEMRLEREVTVFLGRPSIPATVGVLTAELWPLRELERRYRTFMRRFAPIEREPVTPQEAFALRFALMFEYFRITWSDPDLPRELLPANWPGESTRQLAARLYARLLRIATPLPSVSSSAVRSRRTRSPTR